MTKDSISQIMVGKNAIGIIGLEQVIEEISLSHGDFSDHEITAELFKRLSERNYIPSSVRGAYERAFLREYKKFHGLSVTEEEPEGNELNIQILGEGCARCHQMKADLLALLSELKLPAAFEHITDPLAIAAYGPVNRPAITINRKLVTNGQILTKEQLKMLLINLITR